MNKNKFTPLVSIIIPVFNAERYIYHTLKHLLNQDYDNFEIIIVNDNSSDKSIKIVKSFNSSKIKIYNNNKSGASSARNYGITMSSGEYIQFLDADDILSKNKISNQISIAEKYNFNPKILISCSFQRFKTYPFVKKNIGLKKIDKDYNKPVDWLIDSWTGGGMGQTSIWLTHKLLIQSSGIWDESLKKNQDGEFFSRVITQSNKIIFEDKSIVYYRDTKLSISKNKSYESALSTFKSYVKYIDNTKHLCKNDNNLRYALAHCFYSFIRHHYPSHMDLIKKSEEIIYNYGFNLTNFATSSKLTIVAKLFGFYNALKIKRFFNED